ncbi:VAMP-associated protein [Trichocladium antarcticum]|uniref:VAMP-associated protein n=1 Tax=Trichocladium antarcticum TaxID=1450529 RepID=A0AAN6UU95_9PEZI|nr:VAMP-associated protein [Trichocladium antarcticum]
MSVEIDPAELGFRRPFTVEVAQVLKIRNTNNAPVAFKVKTTAPKQYCVRPNSGRIEPGHEVEVSVLLQAMKPEPAPDAKCRDKFLVQSATITGDLEFSSVAQIWDAVERSSVQERKIRVTWLAPLEDSNRLQPVATPSRRPISNGFDKTPDTGATPSYSSPKEDNNTTTTTFDDTTPPSEPADDTQSQSQTQTQTQATAVSAVPVATAASTVKAAAAEAYDDLKGQLARAEATIASLKNDVGSGLRQRKAAAGAGEAGTGTGTGTGTGAKQPALTPQLQQQQPRGTEGVPVQIVAVLCLVSFLLAYVFF